MLVLLVVAMVVVVVVVMAMGLVLERRAIGCQVEKWVLEGQWEAHGGCLLLLLLG